MLARALWGPALVAAAVLAACGDAGPSATAAPLRFLHTFGARDAAFLDEALAGWPAPVATSLVPFARGQTVIGALLRAGHDCPDLIRIDATWLPALAAAQLLRPAPPAIRDRDWLPEARALAEDRGQLWGAPQTVDGLVVLSAGDATGPAPATLDALIATAERAMTTHRWGLGLRADGYWFVPFLRAAGGELAAPATDAAAAPDPIDSAAAIAALTRFAELFPRIAAPPASPGQEDATEARRFRAGEVAFLVTGPWALPDLGDVAALTVWPLPGAPRGGHLLVVPACARDADGAWRLAARLTEPEIQTAWARALGTVPTTATALAAAPSAVRAVHDALTAARPLPRDPHTPLLFDDLTPAVAAVVAGDATASEALAGVRRGWARLTEPSP
ncbi:MAG: extracellular solute-binding protein [Deltaproteobacteria bacterium]|nr:extracellular solute-binding protein [Deltaproteobacteria bacterium]